MKLIWSLLIIFAYESSFHIIYTNSQSARPKDCKDLVSRENANGVYRIWPEAWPIVGSFEVYCDMATDRGGWTIIQRRGYFYGGVPQGFFFKNWEDYKKGFGKVREEFWIGNDRLFALTNQGAYELRIDMTDDQNNQVFAKYGTFWIENEEQLYRLHIDNFSGTDGIGDSFGDLNKHLFTTKDRDNDDNEHGNCAQIYKGGWWYSDHNCHSANLNGINFQDIHQSYGTGINWASWKGYHNSLRKVEMKIRPIN